MKTTVEFLDAVKKKHGLTSDYQLSKHLECTHSGISGYRHGRSKMDEETACQIAQDLGISSGFVLACIAAERAKKPEVKKAWAHAAHLLAGVSALFFAVIMSASLNDDFAIKSGSFVSSMLVSNIHYAQYPFAPWLILTAFLFACYLAYPAPKNRTGGSTKGE